MSAPAWRRLPGRIRGLLLGLACGFCLAACASTPSYAGTHIDPPLEVPSIVGLDLDNRPFDSTAFEGQAGKVQIVFFGYTFCPDMCPAAMHTIAEAYAELPRVQDEIEVLFVTVDPERDTPERLRAYLSAFHAEFRGIRIEDAGALERVAVPYGIYIDSHREAPADQSYLVDHTVRTYVTDRQGRLALTYDSTMDARDLTRDLLTLLRQ